MFDIGEFSSSYAISAECFSPSGSFSSLSSSKKEINKNKNARRFSNEQIKSLETMFERDTKLELRKKLQLARELGLQPRQVATWFQNKRARWKSKQLERDYSILKADYNNIASQYETLKKEKQSLVMQLQKLNDQMQKSQQGMDSIVFDQESDEMWKSQQGMDSRDNTNKNREIDPKISDNDSSMKADYFSLDEDPDHLLKMVEAGDSTSLTSPENWGCNLDDDGMLDMQPNDTTTYDQWWDLWY